MPKAKKNTRRQDQPELLKRWKAIGNYLGIGAASAQALGEGRNAGEAHMPAPAHVATRDVDIAAALGRKMRVNAEVSSMRSLIFFLVLLTGCGSPTRIGFISDPGGATVDGVVSFVHVTIMSDANGTSVTVTAVTLTSSGMPMNFAFCGDHSSEFQLNTTINAVFISGPTCSTLISVSGPLDIVRLKTQRVDGLSHQSASSTKSETL